MRLLRIACALVVAFAVAAPAAMANNQVDGPRAARDVTRTGPCSNTNDHWSLELDREGTRIEVDFEVYTRAAGKTWDVRMKHNGTVFMTGSRVTNALGDFEVERTTSDLAGTDSYIARAERRGSTEVCRGTASI